MSLELAESASGEGERISDETSEIAADHDNSKTSLSDSGLHDGGQSFDNSREDPFLDPAIIAKSRKAAKLFGLDEMQFQKALGNAKEEWKTGIPPADTDGQNNAAAWAAIINHGMLLSMFCGLVWALNRDYGNLATKFFIQLFPREAVALGLATMAPED